MFVFFSQAVKEREHKLSVLARMENNGKKVRYINYTFQVICPGLVAWGEGVKAI